MNYRCPCCDRPFAKMLDYPLVSVQKIEILPIPETMDYWSEEAARARLNRVQLSDDPSIDRQTELHGINRTPEIASAYGSETVQDYLCTLKSYAGQEVRPDTLSPQLEADGYFRWAYRIPGTQLFISLSEAEPDEEARICRVVFHCKGPNFGSAGGPTLQEMGAVAAIHYEGRFSWRGRPDPEKEVTDHSA